MPLSTLSTWSALTPPRSLATYQIVSRAGFSLRTSHLSSTKTCLAKFPISPPGFSGASSCSFSTGGSPHVVSSKRTPACSAHTHGTVLSISGNAPELRKSIQTLAYPMTYFSSTPPLISAPTRYTSCMPYTLTTSTATTGCPSPLTLPVPYTATCKLAAITFLWLASTLLFGLLPLAPRETPSLHRLPLSPIRHPAPRRHPRLRGAVNFSRAILFPFTMLATLQ